MHGAIRRLSSSLAALLAIPSAAAAQTVHYAYDAAGRLSVVADPRGDVAVYHYDAVGNVLSIQRIAVGDLADALVIAHVTPAVAPRGAIVSLFGKGFAATVEANAVSFNDVPATVLSASPTRLTVRVPSTATTGPIHLATPRGAAASPVFHVLDALTLTPATAVVAPRGSVRFMVADDGTSGVRWSVDRIAGGDAQRGTISADGLYTAPATLPLLGVRVMATSVIDPAVEATAHVSMIGSRPLFVAAEPRVVAFPAPAPRAEVTAVVSIGLATSAAFTMARPVALRVAPVILGLTPLAAARGETLRLLLTGAGFDGATRLEFWTVSGPDAALTATNLAVSADGHEATADIAIAADATAGPRIVRIVTGAGPSGDAVAGENLFVVH
jgi:YD repeat-containing protein